MHENDQPVWEHDVVVLVAVRNEYQALGSWIKDFKNPQARVYVWPEGQCGDADLRFDIEYYGSIILRYHVFKLPHPSMGGDATTFLATKAIYQIQPIAICMVGICAGNPKHTKKGDVIVASMTTRHDFGKLVPQPLGRVAKVLNNIFGPKRSKALLSLKHRIHDIRIDSGETKMFRLSDLIDLVDEFNGQQIKRESDAISMDPPTAFLGAYASGNQVIKVPGVFEYLEENKVQSNTGDEDQRIVLAIEMEAHSLAYAAKHSGGLSWMVVKGVVDHADLNKDDSYHKVALENSIAFLGWVLPKAVKRIFGRSDGLKGHQAELARATVAFHDGDFAISRDESTKAYIGGLRTPQARELYLKALMRDGSYDQCKEILTEQLSRPWFQDETTIELLSEIYWREGNYDRAYSLLEQQERSTYRLLYLWAMVNVFLTKNRVDENKRIVLLVEAESAMQKAVEMTKDEPKFFIDINHYFVCRILRDVGKVDYTYCDNSFTRAYRTTNIMLRAHPRRGLIYSYMLMLLALADRDDEFRSCIKTYFHKDFEVALDNIDMIFKRLDVVYANTPETAEKYIAGLVRFLNQHRLRGRAVRSETKGRIR
ncbi:MAG: hypothetical protein JAZ11_02965 [Candidatus Thiodiazotropha lotti]|nr:hypothetical protein [Candidatus Thiodiazotropha lotti]